MIAFVRAVTRRSTSAGSRFSDSGLDVAEHRSRTPPGDRLGRRVEGERRADDLVAGTDVERVEDEHERVGAVRDTDGLRDAEVGGRLLLERLHVRAEDEAPGVDDFGEPFLQLTEKRSVLRSNVDERDHERSV